MTPLRSSIDRPAGNAGLTRYWPRVPETTWRNDGTVLVAGGRYPAGHRVSSAAAQLFVPESGGFVATGSLITARDGHTATLLVDGTVLITGGTHHAACNRAPPCYGPYPYDEVLSSAELFK